MPTAIQRAAQQSHTVLIVHASVGSGHRSAAKSIAEAFGFLLAEHAECVPSDLDVRVIDILDYGRHKFDGDKTASMFVGATRPFYDLTWRYTFTGRILWGGGTIWSRLMFSPFTEYVEQVKPMAIIATHITGANAAVSARMLTGQEFPIICVPTDYETEGLWPHRCADLFCVATESMAETLRARRIPEERIRITGIPTREAFRRSYDQLTTRGAFDLPIDKRIVLILAGAYLPRPYVRLRETVDKVLPYFHALTDFEFVIVAGGDEEYLASLTRRCKELDLPNVRPVGYVTEMAALMSASDLIVCKAGGLTVTECLCAEVPMLLVGKAYGQEKINVEMLTGLGAAMRVTTARELLSALRYVMHHPQSIDAMLVNGRILRKPDAARNVASAAMEQVSKPQDLTSPLRKKSFFRLGWGDKPAHVR
ncbi:MAG: UDP-N-acetylglucosamine--LPS N-acetylglucosamine transferase [Eggerthellaceae bacterium]|nr:UDP-N-acetylglucosamine--LPS N-acetylglucosamine transferase [Eggerthellaceae bacterium]